MHSSGRHADCTDVFVDGFMHVQPAEADEVISVWRATHIALVSLSLKPFPELASIWRCQCAFPKLTCFLLEIKWKHMWIGQTGRGGGNDGTLRFRLAVLLPRP